MRVCVCGGMCAVPVVSDSSVPSNGPCSGLVTSVTLSGLNFGASDYSPTVVVGNVMCTTSSWTSGTSMECSVATAAADSYAVTTSGFVGSFVDSFTFDGIAGDVCFLWFT